MSKIQLIFPQNQVKTLSNIQYDSNGDGSVDTKVFTGNGLQVLSSAKEVALTLVYEGMGNQTVSHFYLGDITDPKYVGSEVALLSDQLFEIKGQPSVTSKNALTFDQVVLSFSSDSGTLYTCNTSNPIYINTLPIICDQPILVESIDVATGYYSFVMVDADCIQGTCIL